MQFYMKKFILESETEWKYFLNNDYPCILTNQTAHHIEMYAQKCSISHKLFQNINDVKWSSDLYKKYNVENDSKEWLQM